MASYTIEKRYFNNITQHQKEVMLNGFNINNDGDITAQYNHKGYTVNNTEIELSEKIKAISMFSGAGGLDIGTQLAGIKVMSSVDIFEDGVQTLKQNSFFNNTDHEVGDITKINGDIIQIY